MTDPELNITRSLIRLGRHVQVVQTVYDLLDWHTGGKNFWRKWRMYATGCVESGIQFGGVVAVTKAERSDSQRLGTNLLWTRASETQTVEWNVPSRAYIACQPGAANSTFVPCPVQCFHSNCWGDTVYISAEWFRHIQCMLVGNTNNGPTRTSFSWQPWCSFLLCGLCIL